MELADLLAHYENHPLTQQLSQALSTGAKPAIGFATAGGSHTAVLAAATYLKTSSAQLLIASSKEEAAYLQNDLEKLLGKTPCYFYPASYRRPYQMEQTDNANVLLRAEVLNHLSSRRRAPLVITYTEALFEKVVTRKELETNTLKLNLGEKITLDFLNETLFEYQFERVDFVTSPGQFSVRGGIVDIFSFSKDHPYRVEFFDDEVESIRYFDIENQRTIGKATKMSIVPNVENKTFLESRASFLSYLPKDTTVWIDSPSLLISGLDRLMELADEAYSELAPTLKRATPAELFLSGDALRRNLMEYMRVEYGRAEWNSTTLESNALPQRAFNKDFPLLAQTLLNAEKSGISTILMCSNPKQIGRFHAIFEDLQLYPNYATTQVALHEGFEDRDTGIFVYTDHQIFDRYQRFNIKNGAQKKQAITLEQLNSLEFGDYVTHVDHGVGKFGGLQKVDNNGTVQEAIKLVYRDNDILYVSIHSLHKISKYNGKDGTAPSLHKLGSAQWQTLKKKTKAKVKKIAFDLIQLYAKRKEAIGFACAPDGYLQHELEASFLYEDTPDQVSATEAVKKDMESAMPMDRLICGDVGFGKTEIAIRAAFKAVANGKQVAILVPTTVLAFQHFKTFSQRLEGFPVTVDYINRFRSAGQQRDTLKKLAEGKIDILIGTHKLVSKTVEYKDLGLLIVDEEQKFGVGVKDKIKTLKVNVDTLTLTATPIPRTLQFSLMAARDLSVMTTPPPNRQPIETELIGFHEETIRDSISYEIQRGGQVFFINNRVSNIQEVAGMVQRLVPDARIAIGHGQMDGKKLEKVMLDFMDGKYDVLVATSIIESGLDVPNANTIIINNANHFGMSDLHQMRGRVGRSNVKAFCKLVTPPISTLTEEARKRLRALEQFTDLGSGFKIAMKDLEIRGAGDMLGGEQSGFISDMGFDTYQKILAETVKELKENEFKDLYEKKEKTLGSDYVDDVQIDTDLELMIPDHYVNNIEERLKLYQRLGELTTEEELQFFALELEDRFGPIPQPVQTLLHSVRIKWAARHIGFTKLIIKSGKLIGHFAAENNSDYYQLPIFSSVLSYLQRNPRQVQVKQKGEKLTFVATDITALDQVYHIFSSITEMNTATL
ncbi:MAG: Transcription-repair-coupling factor [Cryomorphaceae bacterium]|nr:MAG: Transcription-repair-coupling factor [Cryomorphaceae bacterium]